MVAYPSLNTFQQSDLASCLNMDIPWSIWKVLATYKTHPFEGVWVGYKPDMDLQELVGTLFLHKWGKKLSIYKSENYNPEVKLGGTFHLPWRYLF